MHKLLIGKCRTGAKIVRKQKCFGLYLQTMRTNASVTTC